MNRALNNEALHTKNEATRYDAIVIGAGQAGGPLATALARAGRRRHHPPDDALAETSESS